MTASGAVPLTAKGGLTMQMAIAKPNKNDIRSARMRELILKETLNCIYEKGFQNTPTTEITERAGISRGALLYHFPSKEDLVAAALEHLLDQEIQRLRSVADSYARGQLSLDDFVDYLWERFSGRLFMITLDYLATARTDPVIQQTMKRVSAEFHASLNAIWVQFFSDKPGDEEQIQGTLNLTLCVMRGMGAQTIVRDDQRYFDSLRDQWKAVLKGMLNTGPK